MRYQGGSNSCTNQCCCEVFRCRRPLSTVLTKKSLRERCEILAEVMGVHLSGGRATTEIGERGLTTDLILDETGVTDRHRIRMATTTTTTHTPPPLQFHLRVGYHRLRDTLASRMGSHLRRLRPILVAAAVTLTAMGMAMAVREEEITVVNTEEIMEETTEEIRDTEDTLSSLHRIMVASITGHLPVVITVIVDRMMIAVAIEVTGPAVMDPAVVMDIDEAA